MILCSLEPPEGLTVVGRGCLLQAAITRARTPARGEPAARDISDQLPFLEYELHRLLLAKLRVRGMNAIFGLRVSLIDCIIQSFKNSLIILNSDKPEQ